MERVAVCTLGKCVHLSENHDVSRMVQLRVSHVWTHLQYQNRLAGAYRAHLSLRVCREMLHLEMTTLCDDLTIIDFAIYVFCGCASAPINTDAQQNQYAIVSKRNIGVQQHRYTSLAVPSCRKSIQSCNINDLVL